MRQSLTRLFALALMLGPLAEAATLHIASAANFRTTLEKLARNYESETGNRVLISSGATGALYAQAVNGAPFDLLLAADNWRPQQLVELGLAQADTLSTYAVGQLVLVSHQALPATPRDTDIVAQLNRSGVRIALANPQTAPYGAAAKATLQRLGLWSATDPKPALHPPVSGNQQPATTPAIASSPGMTGPVLATPVFANNVAQAFQFFSTGNTDYALVGLAQWLHGAQHDEYHIWRVPTSYYSPLQQDAVVLNNAREPDQARHFLHFLHSTQGTAIIAADGYQPGQRE